LSPKGGHAPTGKIADAINASFGSFDEFKKKFQEEAINHFGSGWVWLVRDDNNKLEIVGAHDAGNPLTQGKTPVLTCDVWGMYTIIWVAYSCIVHSFWTFWNINFCPISEHAYYIDYRNDRAKYLEAFWHLVNWEFASANLK